MNINNFIYQKIEQFHRFFNVYISIYIMRIMILYCNFYARFLDRINHHFQFFQFFSRFSIWKRKKKKNYSSTISKNSEQNFLNVLLAPFQFVFDIVSFQKYPINPDESFRSFPCLTLSKLSKKKLRKEYFQTIFFSISYIIL